MKVVKLLMLGLVAVTAMNAMAISGDHVPRALSFPRDEGKHHDASLEWWYFTGHLNDENGKPRYGYFVTFFHSFGIPNALHASVNDFKTGQFYSLRKIVNPLTARSSKSDLEIVMGDMASVKKTREFQYRIRVHIDSDTELDLVLTSANNRYQLHDNMGYFSVGNVGNYYYSLTNLDTTGFLKVRGQEIRTGGVSWYDHQYGNIWRAGLDFQESYFLAMQLENGEQINAFQVVDKQGNIVMTHGKVVTPSGAVYTLDESLTVEKTVESRGRRNTYGTGWQVNFKSPVNNLNYECSIFTKQTNQEMLSQNFFDKLPNYFEGRGHGNCSIPEGPVTSVEGQSYIETLVWNFFNL